MAQFAAPGKCLLCAGSPHAPVVQAVPNVTLTTSDLVILLEAKREWPLAAQHGLWLQRGVAGEV